MTSIGERIHSRMAEIDMSEQQLADALGVSQQAVNHWKTKPNRKPADLVSIARILGVTADWLRTGEAPKFSTQLRSTTDLWREAIIEAVNDIKLAGLEITPTRLADQSEINVAKRQKS